MRGIAPNLSFCGRLCRVPPSCGGGKTAIFAPLFWRKDSTAFIAGQSDRAGMAACSSGHKSPVAGPTGHGRRLRVPERSPRGGAPLTAAPPAACMPRLRRLRGRRPCASHPGSRASCTGPAMKGRAGVPFRRPLGPGRRFSAAGGTLRLSAGSPAAAFGERQPVRLCAGAPLRPGRPQSRQSSPVTSCPVCCSSQARMRACEAARRRFFSRSILVSA